jgi:alpha-amylase
MTARKPVTFLMAIHCHQPVGNFGFVFDRAYEQSYDPFLRVVERHPGVRLALHYSGPLLDWFAAERPEFLQRLRRLADRGQVELLAAGYYEPILPLLPEADRQGQIAQMHRALKKLFGVEAAGLWLTERVWEPDLPTTLARAGIEYTMVDTSHFTAAKRWLPPGLQVQDETFWDVLGSYATDAAGNSVRLFPASKRLRYWMPFSLPEMTIEFFKRLQRDTPVAITFADDGEKFGMWPNTYKWVYEDGWLDTFFAALERESSWLGTSTFRDYAREVEPDGRVNVPTASYEEMLEWSGGSFRNFFTKYPEANAMQQAMLRVSESVRALEGEAGAKEPRAAKALQQARQQLYAAQCNCAYWHGVFGGLYLGHLRRAVYANLIAAEATLRQLEPRAAAVAVRDEDGDGADEVRLTSPAMSLVVDPNEGGAATAWYLHARRINVVDTLSRRPESYHNALRSKQATTAGAGAGEIPATIHAHVTAKEENLSEHLIYDDHRRTGGIDYALQSQPDLRDVVRSTWGERRLWSIGPYELDRAPSRPAQPFVRLVRRIEQGRLVKTARLDPKQPAAEWHYRVEHLEVPVVALEWNISLWDERYLNEPHEAEGVTRFDIQETGSRVRLTAVSDVPARLIRFPIETVSESEGGLERTYQGLAVIWLWSLNGATTWETLIRWEAGDV